MELGKNRTRWWIMAGTVAIVNDDFYAVTQEWIFESATRSAS